MKNYTPVEGKSGFYRDSESSAIINRDKKAYLNYMKRKKEFQRFTINIITKLKQL